MVIKSETSKSSTIEFIYRFSETLHKAKSKDELFYDSVSPFVSNEYLGCSKAAILLYNEDNQIIKGVFGMEKSVKSLSECANSKFNKTVQNFQMKIKMH